MGSHLMSGFQQRGHEIVYVIRKLLKGPLITHEAMDVY